MEKWTRYKLGDLLEYEQPTPYIVESTDYDDKYETPVLTAGKSFIIGYTDEKDGIYHNLPVIIFDDFTTSTQYVNFPFKVKSSAMKILTADESKILPKFIFYRMQIIDFDHGTHKRYWIQAYSKLEVDIPPLDEQRRIVSRIEELFSELDNSVSTLQKTKEQLSVYRQAVLTMVFDGLESTTVPISTLIEKSRYGTSKKCTPQDSSLTAVYRIPNIDYKRGVLDKCELKYAQFTSSELQVLDLRVGDILLIRSNGSPSIVGRTAVVMEDDVKCTFAGYLIRIRFLSPSFTKGKFYHYFFESSRARIYIEGVSKSTSGVNNVNADEIGKLLVPSCNEEKMKKACGEIESRLSVCDQIEATVDTALKQAEAMRQSILKQAFEGRL